MQDPNSFDEDCGHFMMTRHEMQVQDVLSEAMMERWHRDPPNAERKRAEWWFIHRLQQYWLKRCIEERVDSGEIILDSRFGLI